jgi:small subunit ribosomal protein S16
MISLRVVMKTGPIGRIASCGATRECRALAGSILVNFSTALHIDGAARWRLRQQDHCPRSTFVIKLRLRRTGAKKRPSYRIVAAEHSAPRDGRFIEIIGHYNPLTEPATVKINEERARHWLSVGAQPSDTVAGLLKRAGVIEADAPVQAAPEAQA